VFFLLIKSTINNNNSVCIRTKKYIFESRLKVMDLEKSRLIKYVISRFTRTKKKKLSPLLIN